MEQGGQSAEPPAKKLVRQLNFTSQHTGPPSSAAVPAENPHNLLCPQSLSQPQPQSQQQQRLLQQPHQVQLSRLQMSQLPLPHPTLPLSVPVVLSSTPDRDGIRHVVFCRMIIGSMESVLPNSKQFCPSSENFDSGVNNLQSPTKYIVWYPDVNTRILPLYVLSIKMDIHEKGLKESVTRPTSPWISFQALISVLSSVLPPAMTVIRKLHGDFVEKKMSRKQLIQRVRE